MFRKRPNSKNKLIKSEENTAIANWALRKNLKRPIVQSFKEFRPK
jgi:hypothetical protein